MRSHAWGRGLGMAAGLALLAGLAGPARAVTLDGAFGDWGTAQLLGSDGPGDIGAGDLVDWRNLWAVYQTNQLFISYETQAPIDFALNAWRYELFIDTDNQSASGFRGTAGDLACGAEFLVEGASVFRYTGSGQDWSWSYTGMAAYAISGARLEMGMPGALLGISASSRLKILLAGNDPTQPDYARNDKAGFAFPADRVVLDGNLNDWNSIAVTGTDSVSDVTGGDPVNWRRLRIHGTNGTLYLSYETAAPIDFANHAWRHDVFIDADNNNRSGYRGLSGGSGAEFLIEGATLYQYAGSGYDWAWNLRASLTYGISSSRLEMAVASRILGLATNYASRYRLFGNNPVTADLATDNTPGFYYATSTNGLLTCQGIAIPSYFYPGTLWNQSIAGAPKVGLMVMNPGSGPGSSRDSAYAAAVSNAQAAGIAVMGYVYTSYGARDPALVKADIDLYMSWYQVDGIFLDETASTEVLIPYYQDIDLYIHGYAGSITVLNPGIYPAEGYMGAGDILMAFEGSYSAYNNFAIPAWAKGYAPGRFWHAVYAASQSQMNTAVTKSKSRNAALMYITNDNLPNPYDTLPSYWSTELTKFTGACP